MIRAPHLSYLPDLSPCDIWLFGSLKTSKNATKLTTENHTVEVIATVWRSVPFKIVQVVFQPENAAEVRDRGCWCGSDVIHSISDAEIFRFGPHMRGSPTPKDLFWHLRCIKLAQYMRPVQFMADLCGAMDQSSK
jgi:hypothetical protein